MNASYWDLPEELEKERTKPYEAFSKLFNAKVERIQKNYERDLTEAQFALNKNDEALLIATEEFLNILLLQIDRLCRINSGLNQNLGESIDDVQKITSQGAYKIQLETLIAKHKLLNAKL